MHNLIRGIGKKELRSVCEMPMYNVDISLVGC